MELVSLLSSRKLWFVSESEGRSDDSFPLETAYTVQKAGQCSDIFDDNVRALSIQLSNCVRHKQNVMLYSLKNHATPYENPQE